MNKKYLPNEEYELVKKRALKMPYKRETKNSTMKSSVFTKNIHTSALGRTLM